MTAVGVSGEAAPCVTTTVQYSTIVQYSIAVFGVTWEDWRFLVHSRTQP